MKRIIRDRRLTAAEAAKVGRIRQQVTAELPELLARHRARFPARDPVPELVVQLKAAREERGLSLADVTEITGMDPSALSKLESGLRPNPTFETLARYAAAVGKQLVVSLTNAGEK